MPAAQAKDFEKLLVDPKTKIFHHPAHCSEGHSGLIYFKAADPMDFMAFDEFRCVVCKLAMAAQWFTDEYSEWISERYLANSSSLCECGSAKVGIKPFEAGHSYWCPVTCNPW